MPQPTCVIASCPNTAGARDLKGLCIKCYAGAKKAVEAGTTTWEELAELGLCIIKPTGHFEVAFEKAKAQKDKGTGSEV